MSTLLLDDVGLCLLRQLHEAWEASEEYALSSSQHDYFVTSYNELWELSFKYNAAVEAYISHLQFIYANRHYWPRLTIRLWADMNIGEELSEASDISDFSYIAKKSVQAYKQHID